MNADDTLSELELRILIESKKKSLSEIADLLRMDVEEVSALLDRANRKVSAGYIRTISEEKVFLPRPVAFRIGRKIGQPQIGTMKVGSQIVELLSKGIYSAPWNSLKELISNSFDADATKVEIQYVPEEKKLVVDDDGLGMDYVDFEEHFTFIVRSLKREEGLSTPLFKRPIIGKIGIGFIAVSELCDKIKVTSSKKGADTYFEAEIDFSIMRSEEAKDKEFYEVSRYTLTNHAKENIDEHYTKIELLDLKDPFIDILENRFSPDFEPLSVAFPDLSSLMEEMSSKEIRDVRSEFGPYWEFLINFATVIPVEYLSDGPIFLSQDIKMPNASDSSSDKELLENLHKTLEILEDIKKKLKDYNFQVFLNGMELRKPILLPNEKEIRNGTYGKDLCLFPIENTLETTDPTTGEVSKIFYKGYFYYQRKRIIPQQLRGMITRIKNVAIGGPILDFWGHPYSGDDIYFPQTFGEIYFETGLEDAMNIDRSTFKTSHHEYAETRDVLHEFLRREVFSMAKRMYFKRRSEKAKTKSDARLESRTEAIKEILGKDFDFREIRKFTPEPVKIDKVDKSITLNTLSDTFQGFYKQDRLLLQDIAIALEIATFQSRDVEEIKEVFWRIIRLLTEYRRS